MFISRLYDVMSLSPDGEIKTLRLSRDETRQEAKKIKDTMSQKELSLYDEAITLLKNSGVDLDGYIGKYKGSQLLTTLRKMENSKFALTNIFVCFNVEYLYDCQFTWGDAAFGWFLYAMIKNIKNNNIDIIKTMTSNYFNNFDINNDSAKLAIEFIFKTITKTESLQGDCNFIVQICDEISKREAICAFSDSPNIATKDGKITAFSSNREIFYLKYSKTLLETAKYDECIKLCERSLSDIKDFHNDTDLWIKRNMILAKNMQNYPKDELISDFGELLKKKSDWFMLFDLAKLYKGHNDKESLKYAINAINAYGKMEMKIGLLEFIGDLLKDNGEIDIANKHFLLIKEIRERNAWKIPETLESKITTQDSSNILRDLRAFWDSFKNIQKGIVTKILHDNNKGKVGFINGDQEYYFNIKASDRLCKKVTLNAKVSFEILQNGGKESVKIIKVLD